MQSRKGDCRLVQTEMPAYKLFCSRCARSTTSGRATALRTTYEDYTPVSVFMAYAIPQFPAVKSSCIGYDKILRMASQKPDHDHFYPHTRWWHSVGTSKYVLNFIQSSAPSLMIISSVFDTRSTAHLERVCKTIDFKGNDDLHQKILSLLGYLFINSYCVVWPIA